MSAFGAPAWLLLLPLLLFAARSWAPGARPLRLASLGLIVLALAEPRLVPGDGGLDLWVLMDRSASARDLLEPRRAEIEGLLGRSKSNRDRLVFVDYADGALLRTSAQRPDDGGRVDSPVPDAGAAANLGGTIQRTRTGAAILFAVGRMAAERDRRLLVVSDGFSTEPLTGVLERLLAESVPLDLRLLTPGTERDYRTEALHLPTRVQVGEPFVLEARLVGAPDADLPIVIRRNGEPVGHTMAHLRGGQASVRFVDRVARGGAFRYSAELSPAPGAVADAFPGNDRADAWVEVAGGPRVLLATAYADDAIARALRAQGFTVDVATDLAGLTVGQLTGTRAVLLNNVPAYRLPADFLAALDAYVRVQGGGLLMGGGATSFGAGGYFGSRIDPLLPVSMEMRQEHRKLAVAMAIALDRSGSMAAPVTATATKMDLANEGAARSIGLLGANDGVAVLAVDSEAHRVIPLSSLGEQRDRAIDLVRRIQSGGGGIYIYEALRAAWEELQRAPQGQRHVILFADAADSEEPGDYQRLLETMVAGGATVSVIGLGSPADQDAALLSDIAARGKGRIFFNADPSSLPALFAQETVAVARSAFLQDPVGVRPTAGLLEIAARPLEGLESVDGYNLSYLRPAATAAAFTRDEYEAPLVAFWARGVGRVAAVSFPLGGDHSARARAWPGYGDFVQTLVRWLMGSTVPAGVGLRTRLDGSQLRLEMLFDSSWEEKFAREPPQAVVVPGEQTEAIPLVWEKMAPGRYESRLDLTPDIRYRGAVQIPGTTLPFGPLEAPHGVEFAFDRERIRELRDVSARTGGVERTDLTQVWREGAKRAPHDLRPLVLTVFLLVFLADVLLVRLGLNVSLPRLPAGLGLRGWPSSPGPAAVATPAPSPGDGMSRRPAYTRPVEASEAPNVVQGGQGEPTPRLSRAERLRRAKRGD